MQARERSWRRIGQVLTWAGLLLILAATLIPLPRQAAASAATPLWCLVCGEDGAVDVLNNLLLFMPLGMGLRLIGLPGGRLVLLGALLSFVIELLQFTAIPGRDASLSDVVTNTSGSWAGALVGQHRAQLLMPTRRQSAGLALAAGLVWLAVQAGTAALLRPWAPDVIRGGAWARGIPGRTPFDGTVTGAVVSGILVGDALNSLPELGAKLRQGDVHLDVRLVSGTHAAIWSPVFEVLGPRGSVLSLEAVGRDLAFHAPMQSARLRLRRPALRLPRALPPASGLPLRVTAQGGGDTLSAGWSLAGGRVVTSVQLLGPSLGWSLITPTRYALGPEARWITAGWIAAWLALIGYWTAASRRSPLATGSAVTLLLAAGLALVPVAFGYALSHWTEWLAGTAGVGIGYAGHHFAAYLGERCDSLSTRESC